jgi:aminoglycoside phosphotransferase (APT) family kinase protein
MMHAPGALLAAGRDCDIYEYEPGLVLRRARNGRSLAAEAEAMTYLTEQGFPVPRIDAVSDDGADLVMERIDGPTMVELLGSRPWQVRRCGAVLADLHLQLHEIEAPAHWPAAPLGAGDRVVHLDFHPLNVIMSRRGPIVIDWPYASRGDPHSDVALAWVLMTAGAIPVGGVRGRIMATGRDLLVNGFLRGVDVGAAASRLRDVVTWKVEDLNISAEEQARMWKLVGQRGPSR